MPTATNRTHICDSEGWISLFQYREGRKCIRVQVSARKYTRTYSIQSQKYKAECHFLATCDFASNGRAPMHYSFFYCKLYGVPKYI